MNGGKRATEKHKEAMYKMRCVLERIHTPHAHSKRGKEKRRRRRRWCQENKRYCAYAHQFQHFIYIYINVYRKFFTMFESLSFSSVVQSKSSVFFRSSLSVDPFSLFIPFIYSHSFFLRLHTHIHLALNSIDSQLKWKSTKCCIYSKS